MEYCRGYPEKCNEFCIGYIQMNNIYNLSNVPEKYRWDMKLTEPGRDKSKFIELKNFQENIVEHVEKGDGIFLYSNKRGNGKTSWVCKILHSYFLEVALKNNLRCRGLFVEVP